ncbi:MAG: T9SS type A sorting domain-containing protein [Cryomorphaceae bacterium]|nr:T9SS type A sorting domain-containing protein [Cryomorphaceae bacterium]
MKNLTMTFLAMGVYLFSSASDVQLVVQSVPNNGVVMGNTYRVYAQLPSADQSIHAVFADDESPMEIVSQNGFFQHALGGYQSVDIQPSVVNIEPSLAFDSWVTIGAENSFENNLWNIGIDFEAFTNGGAITSNNGAWFLIPTDERTTSNNGLVLLMQFTTTGEAHGTLNMQGWEAENSVWQARNLTFSTNNAQVFGCTMSDASNYNATATFNDGSCLFNESGTALTVGELAADKAAVEIFPNPVMDGIINFQFNEALDLTKEPLIVQVYDQSGKTVMAHRITNSMIVNGNRAVLEHSLAAGVYTVSITTSTFTNAMNIVVGK